MKKHHWIPLALLLVGNCLSAQTKIRPEDAAKHAGETVTLTARVTSTRFYFRTPERPVVFSLAGEGTDIELLTLVVNNADKAHYFNTGKEWDKQTITVTGTICLVNGKPKIEIKNSGQVAVVKLG